jgi:hypothetical protein
MSKLNLDWSKWFQGILAAVIGGAANTVCAIAVDPVAFNFNDLPKLGKLAVGAAVISLAFYLKQSPVPPEEPEQKQ